MGQHNKRALVRQLQKLGIASRADLAKSLGMSQPTAGKIVDELLSVKILEEVEIAGNGDHGSARLGRPGRQLQLNRSRSGFLGIHLGVQETFLAELPLGADDEDCWRLSFRNPESGTNPASGAAAAASWEKELGAAAKKLKSKNFLGVLVSVPGLVDEGTNRVLFSPNIHWSEGADLAAVIRRIWDVPVLLVQEERAVALGHLFKHPDLENFLLVDFGEGVGGAVIVGG
jgi:DNA-binding Lrp family transcriptional regulator